MQRPVEGGSELGGERGVRAGPGGAAHRRPTRWRRLVRGARRDGAAREGDRRRALVHADRDDERRAAVARPARHGACGRPASGAGSPSTPASRWPPSATSSPRSAWRCRTSATSTCSRSPARSTPPRTAPAGPGATSRPRSSAIELVDGEGDVVWCDEHDRPDLLRARTGRGGCARRDHRRDRSSACRRSTSTRTRRSNRSTTCSPTSTRSRRAPTTPSSSGCPARAAVR